MGKLEISEGTKKGLREVSTIVKMALVLAIFIVIFMVISKISSLTKGSEVGFGKIPPPGDAKDFIGMNYEDVVDRFEDAGFSKIEVEALGDLKFGVLDKDGEVDSITINGDASFKRETGLLRKNKTGYKKNAKVKIQYHSFPEESEE